MRLLGWRENTICNLKPRETVWAQNIDMKDKKTQPPLMPLHKLNAARHKHGYI